jgi:branched-subunit amino acid ABC-type transport system permease component
MEKQKKTNAPVLAGSIVIGSAIIWGGVIIGCSLKLKGTGCYDEISNILVAGLIAHLILIWAPIGIFLSRNKKGKTEEK